MARIRGKGFAEIETSYAERGLTAAWGVPDDCPGAPPSARTLDPHTAALSGIDLDPLAPTQRVTMNLRGWSR